MRLRQILPAVLLPLAVRGQTAGNTLLGSATDIASSTASSATGRPLGDVAQTTNLTYLSYTSTITRDGSAAVTTGVMNSTANGTSSSTSDLTLLVGGTSTLSSNATSRTSSAARPTNTQPCNGYVEFCNRQWSNITYVAAHNFPFTRANNAARNQELGMIDQLNDGVRMLQVQAHYINETVYFCHTSCAILNAGTMEAQFNDLVGWLDQNPYEVVTLLIGNYNQDPVSVYTPPVTNSGLERYLYIPPKTPMARDDWPTTAELILTGKRVIYFMDYMANPAEVPYILDEFSQMWETPFSPTDPDFPCTIQRPPRYAENSNGSENLLYLANHNLNVDFSSLGIEILVPNVADINQTNAVTGNSSLGAMARECAADWGHPPNFLLVDFYNYGMTSGSVFQVAAQMNGVTYRGGCCGNGASSAAAGQLLKSAHVFIAFAVVLLALLL